MRVPEVLMKTGAIILFGLGTILALHATSLFGDDPLRGKQMAVAAFVLFVLGGVFFVFPPVKDWITPRGKKRRNSGTFDRDSADLTGPDASPPAAKQK